MDKLTGRQTARPMGWINRLLGKWTQSSDAKRNTAWEDYGFKERLTFDDFYSMFRRGGLGHAGIRRHADKTWETSPRVVEGDNPKDTHDATVFEKAVSKLARDVYLWPRMHAADWRGRVGRYSALYLVFGDGDRVTGPNEPVTPGAQLIKLQPLFESQLKVKEVDNDHASARYGMPTVFEFVPNALGDDTHSGTVSASDNVTVIHHSRVLVLAEGADDGSIYGIPALEPIYNDLVTIEKIIGAGGEGFWKAVRGGFAIEGDMDPAALAEMFGCDVDEVPDRLNDVIKDYASGMDKALILGNAKATPMSYGMPSPEQPFMVAMYSVSAGLACPIPILIGQQIAQRSSDENSREWNKTVNARRERYMIPTIEALIRHLIALGTLPTPAAGEFRIAWDDLDAPSGEEKLALADKMATINRNSAGTGEVPFLPDEIRQAAGYEPLDLIDYKDDLSAPADSPAQQKAPSSDSPPDLARITADR